jgi:hypothetical protein
MPVAAAAAAAVAVSGKATLTVLPPDWAQTRAALLERVGAIEVALGQIAPIVERLEARAPAPGGMGRNQPSEPLPIDTVEIRLGISAANVWRNEPRAEHQRPEVVRLSYFALKHVAKGVAALSRWLAGKGGDFCEALVKAAGSTAGKVIVGAAALKMLLDGLGTDLAEVLIVLDRWMQAHGLL